MTESEKRDELPNGWTWTVLNDFSEIVLGQSPPSSTYNEEHNGLPFYQGKLEFSSIYPTPRKWCSVPKKIAEKGDVLISVRAPVGPTNICPEKSCIGRGLAAIRGKGGVEPFFILYLIRSVEKALSKSGTGTTFDAINGDQLKLLRLPLAPLPEQQRIVARIEELFSCLDVGVEALQKAKAQLRRYRQSVLKAAVEGRLTEGWRKAHPEIEPAESLLKRIAEKRHNGKRKTNENLNCDLYELPNLPDTWTWTRIGDISEQIQYGTSEKAGEDPVGIPIIRMGNIQEGKLAFEKLKYMPKDFPEIDKFLLRDGDVLFNRTNSAELVGKTAVYKTYHPKSIFASYLIRIVVDKAFYNPDFLSYFINSTYGRKYIAAVVSQQVGQANVNGTKLASMTIPLPAIEEQAKTVEYVERNIFESAETEVNIERIQSHTDYLRQSILKHAFEGKLVLQDPKDEPASVLLEQITAGRSIDSPRRGSRIKSNNTHQMRLTQ